MSKSRKKLALLWFIGSGIIFFVNLIPSLTGVYGEQLTEIWGWLLQTIVPTLSLMLSVYILDAMGKANNIETVDSFFFRLTFWLSLIYLLLVLATIMFRPFYTQTPLDLMKTSNLWLGSIQGLVGLSLGLFFFKEKSDDK